MRRIVVLALAGSALGLSGILLAASTEGTVVSSRAAGDVSGAYTQAAIGEETVILRVGNMFCASCPYIVQQALTRTPGVIGAEVSPRNKLAVVTYDSTQTDVLALINATSELGYPSVMVTR